MHVDIMFLCSTFQATINTNVKVGTVQCDVCKLVIGEVQKVVGSNATKVGFLCVFLSPIVDEILLPFHCLPS